MDRFLIDFFSGTIWNQMRGPSPFGSSTSGRSTHRGRRTLNRAACHRPGLIHRVVLQRVRAWPEWVHDMQATGAQAYAVLTLCRAAEALATRRQVSKLAAANAGRSRCLEWSALLDWAQDWWYFGGSDIDHGRFEDVRRFVEGVSARSLRHYNVLPDCGLNPAEPRL